MKKFGFLLVFFFQVSFAITLPTQNEILHFIQQKNWACSGELLDNASGFLYVKVDDAYIHELIAFIQNEGFEEPPYFGELYSDGAHISVIYTEELEEVPFQVEELHQVFEFEIRGFKIFDTPNWKGVNAAFVLLVHAPALSQIRKKYGLLEDHIFHITIGIQRDPTAVIAW